MTKRRTVEEVQQVLITGMKNVHQESGGYKAACPLHDDTSRDSVSFRIEDSGNLVLHCFAGCDTPGIFYHYGIAMYECFVGRRGSQRDDSIVASYDYHDADGVSIFQVCRMDPKDFHKLRFLKDYLNEQYDVLALPRLNRLSLHGIKATNDI